MSLEDDKLLIIFIRNSELGKVKTRLASSVGERNALKIYNFLQQKTRDISLEANADKVLYYSDKIEKNDIWDNSIFKKQVQIGNDLGYKMLNAFKNSFNLGYKKVVIIGCDLYDLTTEIIDDAFKHLRTYDIVLGPASDGGYYLLGMNCLHSKVFKNKNWGTSTVRAETLNDLQEKKVYLLEEFNDIDVLEDVSNNSELSKFLN